MEDEEKLKQDIESYREVATDLRGCVEFMEGNREKFECYQCPSVANCIHYLHMAVSVLCDWVATFMEGGEDQFVERSKKLFTEEETKETDNSGSLYA